MVAAERSRAAAGALKFALANSEPSRLAGVRRVPDGFWGLRLAGSPTRPLESLHTPVSAINPEQVLLRTRRLELLPRAEVNFDWSGKRLGNPTRTCGVPVGSLIRKRVVGSSGVGRTVSYRSSAGAGRERERAEGHHRAGEPLGAVETLLPAQLGPEAARCHLYRCVSKTRHRLCVATPMSTPRPHRSSAQPVLVLLDRFFYIRDGPRMGVSGSKICRQRGQVPMI